MAQTRMAIGALDEDKVGAFGRVLHQQAAHEKGRENANEEAAKWRASDALSKEGRRRENRAGWFTYYSRLAEVYRERAEHFERLSEQLLDGDVG